MKEDAAAPRYFVEIVAPDRPALHRLHGLGLDLFRRTAAPHPGHGRAHPVAPGAPAPGPDSVVIEGLLTLAEVGQVVDDGCQVLVVETAAARSRAHLETTTFADWLAAITKA